VGVRPLDDNFFVIVKVPVDLKGKYMFNLLQFYVFVYLVKKDYKLEGKLIGAENNVSITNG